jgi:hypothetical protein
MPKGDFTYVANAWKKQTKDKKKVFLSLAFKRTVKAGTPVWMYPNDNKRPGKDDPDWSLSAKTEDLDPNEEPVFVTRNKEEDIPF